MNRKAKGKAAAGDGPSHHGVGVKGSKQSMGALRPRSNGAVERGRMTPLSCGLCAVPSIGRRAFLKGAAAASATLPRAGCGEADLGWLARRLVSPEAEAELGQQAFEQIASKTPVARDPRLHGYVSRIGERIVAASGSPYAKSA